MELVITPGGQVNCLYAETLPLAELGHLSIERASHVEPNASGQWLADLASVDGPVLGPYLRRSEALAAEAAWLSEHWLAAATPQ